MSTPLTDSIQNLTDYINEVTSGNDTNLSDAVATLADGYGNITVDNIASKRLSTRDVIISGTVIIESAFSGYKNLASVRFDNPQLLKLSSLSFNSCSDLTTVIGEYITELGSSVFNNCRLLKNITLPNLNKTDVKCFYNCLSLVDISLPKLQILKDQTFRDCTSLKTVKLASCTAFNGSSHFYSCNNLEDIYLPNEESAYSGAPWGAPSTCTIHYNTQFDENGEPILE